MASSKVGIISEYKDAFGDLASYFKTYGGIRKVCCSPYTHAALLLAVVTSFRWADSDWAGTPLTVLPALLGFSLAAYALLLSLGDESFRRFLALSPPADVKSDGDADESVFVGVSAIFLHFVIIQVLALLLAIVGQTNVLTSFGVSKAFGAVLSAHHLWPNLFHRVGAFLGLFAFYLSIFMAIAAGLDIYHATRWYVKYQIKIWDAGRPRDIQ